MSILPKQVDYHRNIMQGPRYKYLLQPLFNRPDGKVTASNTSELLQWKLPAGVVFNPSRIRLSYTIAAAAAGAGLHTWVADDCFQIAQQLQLVTSTGIILADIPHCNRYTKIADKYFSDHTKFMARANSDLQYPCDSTLADNPINPIDAAIITTNTHKLPSAKRVSGFVNFSEPQYFNISGANAALNMAKYIKLGDVGHGTLLEQDKDIYFSETVYLNLTTSNVNSYACVVPFDDKLESDTVANPVVPVARTAANAVVISNIMLHVPVEDNAIIADSVRAKYESTGIDIRCDYVHGLNNVCNSAYSNVNVQIPQNARAKLKRILNFVYTSSEDLTNIMNAHNLNGEKIATYQTSMDSQQLQNNVLTCLFSTGAFLGNTDYRDNERFLKNSMIQGVPCYQYNWAHIDDFSGDDSIVNGERHANTDNGLDLDVPRNYLIQATTPNAPNVGLSLYTFWTVSKTLHMGKDGIYWA